MKPRRHILSFGLAAAVFLALVGAGCTRSMSAARPGPYTFNIPFRLNSPSVSCPGAPVVSDAASQCDMGGTPIPDCLKAKTGQSVRFVAVPGPGTPPKKDLHFRICFDPFGRACLEATDGELTGTIDPGIPASATNPKIYVFNVYTEQCPVIDPKIIVMP